MFAFHFHLSSIKSTFLHALENIYTAQQAVPVIWYATRKIPPVKPRNMPLAPDILLERTEMEIRVAQQKDHPSKRHAGTLVIVTPNDAVGNG